MSQISHISLKNTKQYEALSHLIVSENTFLIFLIGKWGSGKSHFISEIVSEAKGNLTLEIKELGDVSTVEEALCETIPLYFRIFIFLLTSIFIILFLNFFRSFVANEHISKIFSENIVMDSVLVAFSWIVTNLKGKPFKIVNALYSQTFWFFNKKSSSVKNAMVIDDLERSSLGHSEIYNYIKKLQSKESRLIIVLGVNSDDEELVYKQMASKLGAKVFYKEALSAVNYQILQKYPEGKIFLKEETWMGVVSIREIADIFTYAETHYKSDNNMKLKFLVRECFDKVVEATCQETDWAIAKSNLGIDVHGTPNWTRSQSLSARTEDRIIKSFFDSLHARLISIAFQDHVQEHVKTFGTQQLPSNYMDEPRRTFFKY